MVICPLGGHLDDIFLKGKVNFNKFLQSMCHSFNDDQHMRYAKSLSIVFFTWPLKSLDRLFLFLAVIS